MDTSTSSSRPRLVLIGGTQTSPTVQRKCGCTRAETLAKDQPMLAAEIKPRRFRTQCQRRVYDGPTGRRDGEQDEVAHCFQTFSRTRRRPCASCFAKTVLTDSFWVQDSEQSTRCESFCRLASTFDLVLLVVICTRWTTSGFVCRTLAWYERRSWCIPLSSLWKWLQALRTSSRIIQSAWWKRKT